MSNIERLLSMSSPSLTQSDNDTLSNYEQRPGLISLKRMLEERNGFFAFENSLHVFPFSDLTRELNIQSWNDSTLWKEAYDFDFGELLFFAQDVFGNQFGIGECHIKRFESETGTIEDHSENLDEWAKIVMDDYDFETGFSLSHEWQEANRPLRLGERLAPKTPFVLGGEYTINNLYAADAIELMRFRGDLFNQLKGIPDGTPIKLKIV